MDLIALSPLVPYEGVVHAGGLFLLRHLERFRGGRVVLVAPDGPQQRADRDRAPDWLEVVLAPVDEPRRNSPRHQRDRVLHRSRGPAALPHVLRALSSPDVVRRAAAADVVELHWAELAHLAPVLRARGVRTPLVVVEHDVGSQAQARRTRGKGLLGRAQAALTPLHRRVERRALDRADLLLVFKSGDAELLRRSGVRTPAQVVDPYLEPVAHRPRGGPSSTVLFTGALWREENDAAARWLLDQVWPRVLGQAPAARLVLAGAGPGPELRSQAAAAGAHLTGEVPDLAPWYDAAAVFVAPLWQGGGLKFKVPQAMLHALPVVASPVAVEGLEGALEAGALWAVADDAAGFAAGVVSALADPEAVARTGAVARAWCSERFSFARSGERLRATYEELVARAT